MDFIKVQWFCCNFILQFNFLCYHKPLDFVGDLCYIFSDVYIYIYIYILNSINTVNKPLDFVGDLCYIFSDVYIYIS